MSEPVHGPKPTVSLCREGTVRDGGAYCRVTLTNMSFPVEDTLELLAEEPGSWTPTEGTRTVTNSPRLGHVPSV